MTGTVLASTVAVSVAGLLDHAVLHDLERRGGELHDGELWRLLTSLLVHDSWLALLANVVLLGLVGIAVERRRSRVEWVVLYLVAGVVGELVGIEWQPHGAGNSVAALGVAGALVVDAIRRRPSALLPPGGVLVALGDIHGPAVLTGVVVAGAWASVRDPDGARTARAPHPG